MQKSRGNRMKISRIKTPAIGALGLLMTAWSLPAHSNGDCVTHFQTLYGSGAGTTYAAAGCQTCHTSIPSRNSYGRDVGVCTVAAIQNAESLDSDTLDGQPSVGGDNLTEINAGAQPGWCVATTAGCDNVGDPPASITGPLDPPVGNAAPEAVVGGPYEGQVGTPVQFDGSGSSDPDSDNLSYQWNFGDGNVGTGVAPLHTYASAGSFTVTLVVSDGTLSSPPATTTAAIGEAIVNAPPVAAAGGPYLGEAGMPVQFDGSASFDPDGDALTYTWDFGDGNSGTGATPMHTYAEAGAYTVTIVVNDGVVDSAADTGTADISAPLDNVAPIAHAGGPYAGDTGSPVQFDGSGSGDPNGDPLTYAWDFGDGATGTGLAPSHSYAAGGNYRVTLVVNDGLVDSIPDTVEVPIADAVQPESGQALYDANCLGCHGDPWEEPPYDEGLLGLRRLGGARSCTISGSILGTSIFPGGVPGMQFLQGVVDSADIEAIAGYLNSREVSGEQRYVAACAGCHGINGSGGIVDEDVHGDEADETAEAIQEDGEMRFLGCLPASDIIAISDYLMGFDADNDDDGIDDDEDPDDDNDGINDEDDPDDDNDGLDDDDEYDYGTDPRNHDSDNDDADDGREIDDGTDPLDSDSDDDDLSDGEEIEAGTDPLDDDTDDDGFTDGLEVKVMGTNPLEKTVLDDGSSGGGGGSAGIWLLLALLATRWLRGVTTLFGRNQ
jgi:PKD repeat protein